MRLPLPLLLLALALALVPAQAQRVSDVRQTRHNLSAAGPGTTKAASESQVCVFCHTPHGSDTSAAVPLWNRTLANPSSYTTYDQLGTSSLDGKVAALRISVGTSRHAFASSCRTRKRTPGAVPASVSMSTNSIAPAATSSSCARAKLAPRLPVVSTSTRSTAAADSRN